MIDLNNEELLNINGGGVGKALYYIIGAVVVFFIGVADGLLNPKKCNK